MRIAVIGAGRIGGNAARLLAAAGHEVTISFSRDPAGLAATAEQLGVSAAQPAEAVASADVVVLSVPWRVVDAALAAAGDLAGKIVIDTTNQFGPAGLVDLGGQSAARHNAGKAPGARWAKAFNTLTAGFQASAAGRTGPDRVALFYATDHDDAVPVLESLIDDAGFVPVRTGTLDRTEVGHQEPKGDLYGEEFHAEQARSLVARLRGTPPSGRGRP
jgi:predicted dinucleotide-binding enzyme